MLLLTYVGGFVIQLRKLRWPYFVLINAANDTTLHIYFAMQVVWVSLTWDIYTCDHNITSQLIGLNIYLLEGILSLLWLKYSLNDTKAGNGHAILISCLEMEIKQIKCFWIIQKVQVASENSPFVRLWHMKSLSHFMVNPQQQTHFRECAMKNALLETV